MTYNDSGTCVEAQRIYRLLKQHGYRGGGRTSAATRYWDRVFGLDDPRYGLGVCDAHRVYTNRFTGDWESENLAGGPCTTGNGAAALARHLHTVKYERPEEWHAKRLAELQAIRKGEDT